MSEPNLNHKFIPFKRIKDMANRTKRGRKERLERKNRDRGIDTLHQGQT
jgi:hypothetical protein